MSSFIGPYDTIMEASFLFAYMKIHTEYTFLESLGLHPHEVKIYLEGLAIGKQATSVFARKIAVPRSSVQVYLGNLAKKGMMIRSLHKGVQYYTSIPPEELETILAHEKQRVAQMENSLTSVMGLLQSHHKTEFALPNMTTYEGLDGVQKIYDFIIKEKEEVYFFRSPFYNYENKVPSETITRFISMLKKAQVPMKGLTHKYKKYSVNYILERDLFFGVTRRFSSLDIFNNPSQLILFGEYLATITSDGELSCILIRSAPLSTMLKNIFTCIWELSLRYHEEVIKKDDPLSYEEGFRYFDKIH